MIYQVGGVSTVSEFTNYESISSGFSYRYARPKSITDSLASQSSLPASPAPCMSEWVCVSRLPEGFCRIPGTLVAFGDASSNWSQLGYSVCKEMTSQLQDDGLWDMNVFRWWCQRSSLPLKRLDGLQKTRIISLNTQGFIERLVFSDESCYRVISRVGFSSRLPPPELDRNRNIPSRCTPDIQGIWLFSNDTTHWQSVLSHSASSGGNDASHGDIYRGN